MQSPGLAQRAVIPQVTDEVTAGAKTKIAPGEVELVSHRINVEHSDVLISTPRDGGAPDTHAGSLKHLTGRLPVLIHAEHFGVGEQGEGWSVERVQVTTNDEW